jgi:hypothetical protein
MAASAANDKLAQAEKLVSDLQFSEAERMLQAASAVPNNDRATVIRIVELQAISAASLKHRDRAQTLFRTLLSIDPDHHLAADYSPRVTTPFFEARRWVAEHGALRAEPDMRGASTAVPPGIHVVSDPFTLAKKARFHLRGSEASWWTTESPLTAGEAQAVLGTNPPPVAWWAELLNDRDGVLFGVGSESAPILPQAEIVPAIPTPPPIVAAAPWAESPSAATGQVSASTTPAEPRYRPGAYAAAGVGVAALIGGAVCGVFSRQAQSTLDGVNPNSAGLVSGITQRDAFGLKNQVVTDGTAANVLFVGGGVLTAAGVALWFFGGSVAVTPAAGGVAASGTF